MTSAVANPAAPDQGEEVADRIAEQLGAVGVKARVEKYEDLQVYQNALAEGNAGDIMLMWTSDNSTFRLLHDMISSRVKGPLWQGVEDDAAQTLIDEANAESDITDRERRYSRVVSHLNRNPHWLYLYHPITAFARTAGVDDVESLHTGVFRFPGAW